MLLRQRQHRTLLLCPPLSRTTTSAHERRFHKIFGLPSRKRTLRIEAAPLSPVRQPSFPWSHRRTKRTRDQTVVFDPVWSRVLMGGTPVGVGRGHIHRFDWYTLDEQLGCCGVRAQLGCVHLRKVVFRLGDRLTISYQHPTPTRPPKERPISSLASDSRTIENPQASSLFCMVPIEVLLRQASGRRTP